jgi:hypothetical protein
MISTGKEAVMPTATPTSDLVDIVKTNLNNMIDFTNEVHDYCQDRINTVYNFEASPQSGDPGNLVALNILISIFTGGLSDMPAGWFRAEGELAGPVGVGIGMGAGLLAGILSAFTGSNSQPSLNAEFAKIWDRFSATFEAQLTQLSSYYSDPIGHWQDTLTNPLNNQSMTVGDLANGTFPAKGEKTFQQYVFAAVRHYEISLWYQTFHDNFYMASTQTTGWEPSFPAGTFVTNYPGAYNQLQSSGNGRLYALTANSNGSVDQGLSSDAANHLFIDDGAGKVLNPGALVYRADVYVQWARGFPFLPSPHPITNNLGPGPLVKFIPGTSWTFAADQPSTSGIIAGVPAPRYVQQGGTQIFVRGVDSHLYNLWSPSDTTTITPLDLSKMAHGGQSIASDPINGPDVYAQGTNGQLLVFSWDAQKSWVCTSVSGPTLAGQPALLTDTSDGSIQLYACGRDGHLYQFTRAQGSASFSVALVPTNPLLSSAAVGSPTVGPLIVNGTTAGYVMYWRTADNSLYACLEDFMIGNASDHFASERVISTPSDSSHGVSITGDPVLFVDSDGTQFVFVCNADGHLLVFTIDNLQDNYSLTDITVQSGGFAFGYGRPVPFKSSDGILHVCVRGASGQLLDFSLATQTAGFSWQCVDVTLQAQGACLLASDPCIYNNGGAIALYAAGSRYASGT